MMNNKFPLKIQKKTEVSPYDEPATLLSRLGDSNYTSEFFKINRMGRNSKVWFFINIGDKQYLGQAVALANTWKISVFDSSMGDYKMKTIAEFGADDRFQLEEMMYSLYLELEKLNDNSLYNDEESVQGTNID